MPLVIVTGSSGLVGSQAARTFSEKGYDVVGIDNGMRGYFFGSDGDNSWASNRNNNQLKNFRHEAVDIREQNAVNRIFQKYNSDINCVVHTAAQPSHDWAAREPITDFSVNAVGTLNLLEAARQHCPKASFLFTSTNKVYGDASNRLPFVELATRYELPKGHELHEGISETFDIDQSLHSLFGASKLSADILAQEYGRYFGMKTAIFRAGCITGSDHSGAELHGFLNYLVKCALSGKHYTIFGYKGKQVRDNIHAADLAEAFWHTADKPTSGEVFNIGGGRHCNCSVLEAIELIESYTGKKVSYSISEVARTGDHQWWLSDCSKFQNMYPNWNYTYSASDLVREIADGVEDRLTNKSGSAESRLELA